jgi:hypothetical protein
LMSRIRILQAHATYNACKTTRPLTCMPFPLPCQLWCQYPAQGICWKYYAAKHLYHPFMWQQQ